MWIGKVKKQLMMAYLKIISWYLPGKTEENHESPPSV
jgi:hypothetical protein